VGSLAWGGTSIPHELLTIKVVGDESPLCAGGAERAYEVKWDFLADDAITAYDVQGWSLGVLLENDGGATSYISEVAISQDVLSLKNGGPADFKTTTAYSDPGDAGSGVGVDPSASGLNVLAVTQGVVIDFMAQVVLPAPVNNVGAVDLVVVLDGSGAGTTTIGFTDAVGSPPTKTVAVVGGGSYSPYMVGEVVADPDEMAGISIDILGPDAPECQSCFYYRIPAGDPLEPSSDEGIASVERAILLEEVPADPSADPSDVQALSLSMVVPAGLEVDGALGADTQDAEYFQFVASTGCIASGIVMEFEAPWDGKVLSAIPAAEVLVLTISTVPADWIGVETPATLELVLDNCSVPPVAPVVVVGGESRAICDPAEVVLVQDVIPVTQIPFIRGDANVDGIVDVADPIFIINWLFRVGADAPVCLDAADANDDNTHDTSDVVYLLSYVFDVEVVAGDPPVTYMPQPPAPPFPECGLDMTGGTGASCESYPPCNP
jgi:hypothetical protein